MQAFKFDLCNDEVDFKTRTVLKLQFYKAFGSAWFFIVLNEQLTHTRINVA